MVLIIPHRYVPTLPGPSVNAGHEPETRRCKRKSVAPSVNQLLQCLKQARSSLLRWVMLLLIPGAVTLAGCTGIAVPPVATPHAGRDAPPASTGIADDPDRTASDNPADNAKADADSTPSEASRDQESAEAGGGRLQPHGRNLWTAFRAELRLPTSTNRSEVQDALRAYARDRDMGRVFIGRGSILLPMVVAEARRNNLPVELAFVPFVESKLNPTASNAGNVGMWQFQAGTARLMGLQTGPGIDERKDPVRATRAAFSYLRRLHGIFGDWMLALVAYNIGDGRLKQILAAGAPTRDIWKLDLPVHTRAHMAKLSALWQIARNPSAAGIEVPWVADGLDVQRATLARAGSLRNFAAERGTTVDTLSLLNAHLDVGQLRAGTAVWMIDGPVAARSASSTDLQTQHAAEDSSSSEHNASAPSEQPYQVRSGDSLYSIARGFGTTVGVLRSHNKLTSDSLRVGQLLVIPKL